MNSAISMNILVTGGAGFIGTNFIRHTLAVRPDWRIVNLDALTYAGNPANFEDLPSEQAERYRFIHGDIGDTSLIKQIFSEELPLRRELDEDQYGYVCLYQKV